jgi:hypothetical protein
MACDPPESDSQSSSSAMGPCWDAVKSSSGTSSSLTIVDIDCVGIGAVGSDVDDYQCNKFGLWCTISSSLHIGGDVFLPQRKHTRKVQPRCFTQLCPACDAFNTPKHGSIQMSKAYQIQKNTITDETQ